MVQRVPSHLGETTRDPVSPWVVIAGVIVLFLVSCGVLFILLDVPSRLSAFGPKPPPTATGTPRVVTPAVTSLAVTQAPPPATATATIVAVKYKVKSGDTLSTIAAKFHITVQALMAANGLKDEAIRAGDDLLIPQPTPTPGSGASLPQPSGASVASVISTPTAISFQPAPTSASPVATPGIVQYTVARGDTLSSIAAVYGSTIDAIRIANQFSGDMLSIGQVVSVPVGAWTPTTVPTPVPLVTATPTSQYAYAAPSLLSPADNQSFRGGKDLPTLQWTSPAILKADELYVVHIDYGSGATKKSIVRQVKQGTSLQLVATDYPGANAAGTAFSWYVIVVNQPKSRAETTSMQSIAQSPPSDPRSFTWY